MKNYRHLITKLAVQCHVQSTSHSRIGTSHKYFQGVNISWKAVIDPGHWRRIFWCRKWKPLNPKLKGKAKISQSGLRLSIRESTRWLHGHQKGGICLQVVCQVIILVPIKLWMNQSSSLAVWIRQFLQFFSPSSGWTHSDQPHKGPAFS